MLMLHPRKSKKYLSKLTVAKAVKSCSSLMLFWIARSSPTWRSWAQDFWNTKRTSSWRPLLCILKAAIASCLGHQKKRRVFSTTSESSSASAAKPNHLLSKIMKRASGSPSSNTTISASVGFTQKSKFSASNSEERRTSTPVRAQKWLWVMSLR